MVMSPYAITFLGEDGAPLGSEVRWFGHDDDAIDEVGSSDHPHVIVLHQGDRLVARFPPWPPADAPVSAGRGR